MVTITVKVTPRAKRTEIVGYQGGVLRVRLTEPPLEGKANKALIKFLAAELGVSASRISIVKGATSRTKVLEVPDGALSLQNQLI